MDIYQYEAPSPSFSEFGLLPSQRQNNQKITKSKHSTIATQSTITMMNNNSHQYYYPPPASSSSVSINNTLSTEKMNGNNNNNIGAISSDGVPSSGIAVPSGTINTTTTVVHPNIQTDQQKSLSEREAALREAASSSIISSTASIMMMNNNKIDAQQPSTMATPMVPLAYQPSSTAAAVGFMNMGGAALSGGLLPSPQHHQQRQAQQQAQKQQTHVQQQLQVQRQQHQQQQRQQRTQQQAQLTWRNGEKTFPYKVYDMLEYAVMNGFDHVCSWTVVDDVVGGGSGGEGGGSGGGGDGRGDAFVIHNRELFTETILPKFFVHKNWRSFVSMCVCIGGELLCDFVERLCI
jgi:hypothetical protein